MKWFWIIGALLLSLGGNAKRPKTTEIPAPVTAATMAPLDTLGGFWLWTPTTLPFFAAPGEDMRSTFLAPKTQVWIGGYLTSAGQQYFWATHDSTRGYFPSTTLLSITTSSDQMRLRRLVERDMTKVETAKPASATTDTVTRFWVDESKRAWVRLKHDAWLWGGLEMDPKNSTRLPAGTIVEIVGAEAGSGFFKAVADSKTGRLAQINVPKNAASDSILAKARTDEIKRLAAEGRRAKAKEEQRKAARKKALIEKYGEADGGRAYEGKAWIGMTAEMARESWGAPADINTTVTKYHKREQWVYEIGETGRAYLYFEDGILTSYQH